jgi:peptidyl-prolyl cis-trans isomerase A (cyclophilin A)
MITMKRLLFALLALAACSKSEKAAPPAPSTPAAPVKGPVSAEITTPQGTIRCQLLPEAAPETVASFVALARGEKEFRDVKTGQMVKRPFFDGLLFHRVIPEFMIQGGDPLSIDPDHPGIGTGGPGYTLPDEIAPSVKFDRPGMMAMANTGPRTHSGGSQFFITENPVPRLDGGYTIFGRCGDLEVIKAVARVPRRADDRPETPVTMKVKILTE